MYCCYFFAGFSLRFFLFSSLSFLVSGLSFFIPNRISTCNYEGQRFNSFENAQKIVAEGAPSHGLFGSEHALAESYSFCYLWSGFDRKKRIVLGFSEQLIDGYAIRVINKCC
jgi:hypothetical protein